MLLRIDNLNRWPLRRTATTLAAALALTVAAAAVLADRAGGDEPTFGFASDPPAAAGDSTPQRSSRRPTLESRKPARGATELRTAERPPAMGLDEHIASGEPTLVPTRDPAASTTVDKSAAPAKRDTWQTFFSLSGDDRKKPKAEQHAGPEPRRAEVPDQAADIKPTTPEPRAADQRAETTTAAANRAPAAGEPKELPVDTPRVARSIDPPENALRTPGVSPAEMRPPAKPPQAEPVDVDLRRAQSTIRLFALLGIERAEVTVPDSLSETAEVKTRGSISETATRDSLSLGESAGVRGSENTIDEIKPSPAQPYRHQIATFPLPLRERAGVRGIESTIAENKPSSAQPYRHQIAASPLSLRERAGVRASETNVAENSPADNSPAEPDAAQPATPNRPDPQQLAESPAPRRAVRNTAPNLKPLDMMQQLLTIEPIADPPGLRVPLALPVPGGGREQPDRADQQPAATPEQLAEHAPAAAETNTAAAAADEQQQAEPTDPATVAEAQPEPTAAPAEQLADQVEGAASRPGTSELADTTAAPPTAEPLDAGTPASQPVAAKTLIHKPQPQPQRQPSRTATESMFAELLAGGAAPARALPVAESQPQSTEPVPAATTLAAHPARVDPAETAASQRSAAQPEPDLPSPPGELFTPSSAPREVVTPRLAGLRPQQVENAQPPADANPGVAAADLPKPMAQAAPTALAALVRAEPDRASVPQLELTPKPQAAHDRRTVAAPATTHEPPVTQPRSQLNQFVQNRPLPPEQIRTGAGQGAAEERSQPFDQIPRLLPPTIEASRDVDPGPAPNSSALARSVQPSPVRLDPRGHVPVEHGQQPQTSIVTPRPIQPPDDTQLHLTTRTSYPLRTPWRVSRVSVSDRLVCDAMQFAPHEVALVAKQAGQTDVSVWFVGQQTPRTYRVVVRGLAAEEQSFDAEYYKLQELLDELFPQSVVILDPGADQLIVRGEAKDRQEAVQILSVIRNARLIPVVDQLQLRR